MIWQYQNNPSAKFSKNKIEEIKAEIIRKEIMSNETKEQQKYSQNVHIDRYGNMYEEEDSFAPTHHRHA